MRHLIDTAVGQVGRLISDLRPSLCDLEGLWIALETQVRDFSRCGDVSCRWSIDITPGLKAPHGPLAKAVCGIFHELLDNVVRHACASEVEIRISATPSDITLVVKDNGRGAPPSVFDSRDANGVIAMRERVGQFGGWLHIDSHLGSGTTVILTMPLYQETNVPPQLNPSAA